MGSAARCGFIAWAFVAAVLAGCLEGTGGETRSPASFASANYERPVFVGMVDSEINPYRAEFVATHPSLDAAHWVEGLTGPDGGAPQVVKLSNAGTLEARREADRDFWVGLQVNRLYAFEGTRVMAVSVQEPGSAAILARRGDGHGTPTASLLARSAPDALIVMVVHDGAFCFQDARTDCYIDPSTSRAMAWLASAPEVDLASVSFGLSANEPQSTTLAPEADDYFSASRAFAGRGAIVVNAAGNYVSPILASYFAGPPWVIAVGGFEPGPRGESAFASKLPDVVANFTEQIAIASSLNETAWSSGTSFGTPIVAGTLARALAEVRRELGHEGGITPDGALAVGRTRDGRAVRVTSETLRDALNASATFVAPTQWDPANASAPFDPLLFWTRTSVPVVAPPVQMGWGYVHAGLASEIARRVLEGDTGVPPEKAVAAEWMGSVQAAREAYWANWPE